MSFNIAIDGPAGAGKSTAAKLAAKELGFIYVDTGAMYRTIALYLLRSGTDIEEEAALQAALEDIDVRISYEQGVQHMILNGEDVSGLIRTPEVSDMASRSSARPAVRKKLLGENLIADPGLVDPCHFDFTLKETSPALKKGFESWDYGSSGTLPGTVIGLNGEGGQTAYNDHAVPQTPGGSKVKLAFFKELINRLYAKLQKLLRMLGIKETVC